MTSKCKTCGIDEKKHCSQWFDGLVWKTCEKFQPEDVPWLSSYRDEKQKKGCGKMYNHWVKEEPVVSTCGVTEEHLCQSCSKWLKRGRQLGTNNENTLKMLACSIPCGRNENQSPSVKTSRGKDKPEDLTKVVSSGTQSPTSRGKENKLVMSPSLADGTQSPRSKSNIPRDEDTFNLSDEIYFIDKIGREVILAKKVQEFIRRLKDNNDYKVVTFEKIDKLAGEKLK